MTYRRLQELIDEDEADQSCCDSSCPSSITPPQQQLVRIATWPQASNELNHYANLYNAQHDQTKIVVQTLPSLFDLQDAIEVEQTLIAIDSVPNLDGYVVPPMLLGTLSDDLASVVLGQEYLPLYQHLTTVDGSTAAVPLFGGNPLLLFYKKDVLAAPPNTWQELAELAKTRRICLGGRRSLEACRMRSSQTGMPCHSQSMSYWTMVLASMSQSRGSSAGWLFSVDKISGRMVPLLNQTLGPTLEIMEEQLLYDDVLALQKDASENLQAFRDGTCAITISSQHHMDLLQDPNVGVTSLPGSPMVLNRQGQLGSCTFRNCTHGRLNPNVPGQGVNRAPMVAFEDMAMGTILEASAKQNLVQEFFDFVQEHRNAIQPLTRNELQNFAKSNPSLQEYANLIEESTGNPNVVWPLTIPASLDLLSELDQQVYEYLVAGNYTSEARNQVVQSVDKAWKIRIPQQDARVHATPLSVLYQRSLQGVVTAQTVDMYIGTGFRIVGWAMGGIACAMAVGFAIWVYVHQEKRVVRASQPLFLWLVCAGAFIMASCIFPFGIEDDIVTYRGASIACMSSMWQYGLGFVMMVSALYSKIWRINRIFRYQHKLRRITIEKKHILVPFGILFSINFLFLMIWTIVDPYEWIREEAVPGFTNGFCYSENYWAFLAMLVFCNLLVACYTLIQAFECRKLSTEYNENTWIGFSLACLVQVWLIGLPILQLMGDEPDWLFITKTSIVFFTCVSTLLCIFVPKIRFLREEAHKEEEAHGALGGSGRVSIMDVVAKPFQSTFGAIRLGSQYMMSRASQNPVTQNRNRRTSGVIGIRIMRATGEYAKDMERLQNNFNAADTRRRMLQEQLESLQERFEQYIISNHPHGAHVGAHMERFGGSLRGFDENK